MNSSQFEPFNHYFMIQKLNNIRRCMLYIGYWAKSKVFIQQIFNDRVPFAEGDMHLHCSLTVTYIANFLLGDSVDISENGWKIIVCHVLEGKLPKLLIFVWIVFSVIPRVLVASAVAKPYVVASIREHKCGSFVFIVDEPSVRTVDETMLQDDWLEARPNHASFPLDSEHGENVAVLGHHLMRLHWIVVVLAIGHKLQFGLWVCRKSARYAQREQNQYSLKGHESFWRLIIIFNNSLQQNTCQPYQNHSSNIENQIVLGTARKSLGLLVPLCFQILWNFKQEAEPPF